MQLHIDKSIFCWINKNSGENSAVRHDSIAETPDIQLHGREWRSAGRNKWAVTLGKLRFFKRVEPNEYVTYLGSSQSHTGEWRSDYEATMDEVNAEVAILGRSKTSLDELTVPYEIHSPYCQYGRHG
jgi:hypothetical protein